MKKNNLCFYPMRMSPVYKDYLWGGKKLNLFNKKNNKDIIAESWEVSCNESGLTKIDNGYYNGKTLKEIIFLDKVSFLGANASKYEDFPILIKLIDAECDLSIQVHPSVDNVRMCNGERAKSEFWYIVDCEEDSFIYCGFKRDITRQLFLEYVNGKKVCELINKIHVKPGQGYYIPSGTIHALGKGVTAAEIQQNSDTTFRIYDYDRRDASSNLRPLHIDRAADVLNFKRMIPEMNLKDEIFYFNCDYFNVSKEYIYESKLFKKDENTFSVIQFINGEGIIIHNDILYYCKKGDTFFIPAKIKTFTIKGSCKVLITQL